MASLVIILCLFLEGPLQTVLPPRPPRGGGIRPHGARKLVSASKAHTVVLQVAALIAISDAMMQSDDDIACLRTIADNVIYPGAPELLAHLGLRVAPATDPFGIETLQAASSSQQPSDLYTTTTRGRYAAVLLPADFEFKGQLIPDTKPDGMSVAVLVEGLEGDAAEKARERLARFVATAVSLCP